MSLCVQVFQWEMLPGKASRDLGMGSGRLGKEPGRGAMWCTEQYRTEGGLPLGSVPQGALGSVWITLLSVPLKIKGASTCTPLHPPVPG